MSEPTFEDLWNKYPLPELGTYNVGTIPYVENLRVNGIYLPSFVGDSRYTGNLVKLPERCKDWLPFFSSIKSANNLFSFLTKKYSLNGTNAIGGLIFTHVSDSIQLYIHYFGTSTDSYIHDLGGFDLTLSQLKSIISNLEDVSKWEKCNVYLGNLNPKIPEPDFNKITGSRQLADYMKSNDWNRSGVVPAGDLSEDVIHRVRVSYSQMYHYMVSECYNV